MEHMQEKMQRVSGRFLSEKELEHTGEDLQKICIYWCAKEAMYKLYNIKDTEFKGNLKVSPFQKEEHGQIEGIIHVGSFLSKSEIHRDLVMTNVPPAWVHHVRPNHAIADSK